MTRDPRPGTDRTGEPEPPAPSPNGGAADEPEYGDMLLVDLLHPDVSHFFSRYRTDLVGLIVVAAIVAFIIWITRALMMIGAAGSAAGAISG